MAGSIATAAAALVGVATIFATSGLTCIPIDGGVACTEIGCNDGLSVDLTGNVPTSGTVEAEDLDSGEIRSEAIQVIQGTANIFFAEFTPTNVTVRVMDDSVLASVDVAPTYETARPNGPDCPPECSQARLSINVP
jgi:hypothetical protein